MSRRRKGSPVSGWINLDKPLGMTSTQAVSKVRRLLDHLKSSDGGRYQTLIETLGLRR